MGEEEVLEARSGVGGDSDLVMMLFVLFLLA